MYIKTDFHIYKIKSEEIIQGEKYYNIEIRGGLNKLNAKFGKQSENLEELCDAFATVRKNASGTYSVFFIELEDWKTWINGYNIYGAIWTEWGLKYVAKMNEKGVLELI